MAITIEDYYEVYPELQDYPALDATTIDNKFQQVPDPPDSPTPPGVTLAHHNKVFNIISNGHDFEASINKYEYFESETGVTHRGVHAVAVELGLWDSQVVTIARGIRACYTLWLADQ